MARRIYDVDECFFDCINTEDKAYWLGFLSADGYVSEDRGNIRLALKSSDALHVQKFLDAVGSTSPLRRDITVVDGKSYESVRTDVHSMRLVKGIVRLGVRQAKSLSIRPCEVVEDNLQRHYWRGLFDGDGSICKASRKRAFMLRLYGTEEIVSGFKEFASNYTHMNPSVRQINRTSIYGISYCGLGGLQLLVRAMYAGAIVYLDRKKEIIDKLLAEKPLLSRGLVKAAVSN